MAQDQDNYLYIDSTFDPAYDLDGIIGSIYLVIKKDDDTEDYVLYDVVIAISDYLFIYNEKDGIMGYFHPSNSKDEVSCLAFRNTSEHF